MFTGNKFKRIVSHGNTSAFEPHTIDSAITVLDQSSASVGPYELFSGSLGLPVATGYYVLNNPEEGLNWNCLPIGASLSGNQSVIPGTGLYQLGYSNTGTAPNSSSFVAFTGYVSFTGMSAGSIPDAPGGFTFNGGVVSNSISGSGVAPMVLPIPPPSSGPITTSGWWPTIYVQSPATDTAGEIVAKIWHVCP